MSNDILILLCSLNGEKSFLTKIIFLDKALPSFLGRELAIDAHKTRSSSNILILFAIAIVESSDEIDDAVFVRLSPYV